MEPKVLITPRSFARWDDKPLRHLREAGCRLKRNPGQRPYTEAELIETAAEFDAFLVGLDPVTENVLAAAPRLKVISKYGAGLDNIDLEAATRRGVVVAFTPGANSEAVADLTFGLMLATGRRIVQAHESLRSGRWESFLGVDLWGATLGLVGAGRIGRAVACRARGFNMRVLAYDTSPDHNWAESSGVSYVELEELIRQSDFVSVHLPLTDKTRGLIGARLLEMMKPTAVLVNTARGGVVDEKALLEALERERIFGAALDVYSTEPPQNRELFPRGRLVTTPHISAYSRGALLEMGIQAADNLIRVLKGERPGDVANPEVYK